LKPTLAAELRYKKPSTLTQASNMAMEFEASFTRLQPKTPGFYNEINNTGYNHYIQRNANSFRSNFRKDDNKPQQFNTTVKYNHEKKDEST
jgi:hypothetical protein